MRAAVEKRRHDRTSQDVLVMCAPVLGSASGEIFELPMSPSTTLLLLKCSWPSPRSSAATSIDVSLQRLKRSVSPWRTYAHRKLRCVARGGRRALQQHRNPTPVRSHPLRRPSD